MRVRAVQGQVRISSSRNLNMEESDKDKLDEMKTNLEV